MSCSDDDIVRVKELWKKGYSLCGISRYIGLSYSEVRRILGRDRTQAPPLADSNLSTRQRQKLLSWPLSTARAKIT